MTTTSYTVRFVYHVSTIYGNFGSEHGQTQSARRYHNSLDDIKAEGKRGDLLTKLVLLLNLSFAVLVIFFFIFLRLKNSISSSFILTKLEKVNAFIWIQFLRFLHWCVTCNSRRHFQPVRINKKCEFILIIFVWCFVFFCTYLIWKFFHVRLENCFNFATSERNTVLFL